MDNITMRTIKIFLTYLNLEIPHRTWRKIKAPFVLLHWSTNSHGAAGFSELLWWHSWNQFIRWESGENSKALRWFWIYTSPEWHARELHKWRVPHLVQRSPKKVILIILLYLFLEWWAFGFNFWMSFGQ